MDSQGGDVTYSLQQQLVGGVAGGDVDGELNGLLLDEGVFQQVARHLQKVDELGQKFCRPHTFAVLLAPTKNSNHHTAA